MKVKMKYLLFIVLLFGVGGFILATDLTVTGTVPANYTNYTTGQVEMALTVSPASNTSKCTFIFTSSNGTSNAAIQMVNTSADNTTFTNASAYTPNNDNTYETWHNMTFTCTNLTAGNTFTSLIYWGYDTTNPTIDQESVTINNQSTGGNNLSITFNSTDVNNDLCGVYISDRVNTLENTVAGTWEEAIQDRQCNVEISNSMFAKNGNYTLTPYATDSLGNTVHGTNQTYTAYQLKTGWNMIEIAENLTLNNVASLVDNITIVSSYANLGKSYTTFTVGSSSNSAYIANATNATYVYTDDNVLLLREHAILTDYQNATLYDMASTGWNQMGMINRHSLNETMYNTTEGGFLLFYKLDGAVDATIANSSSIDYVSYYNGTSGKYCTARRGFKSTSCSPSLNVTDITVERGQALWILVNENITVERGSS